MLDLVDLSVVNAKNKSKTDVCESEYAWKKMTTVVATVLEVHLLIHTLTVRLVSR